MYNRDDNPSLNAYYTMEKFIKELKKSFKEGEQPPEFNLQTTVDNYTFKSPYSNIKPNYTNVPTRRETNPNDNIKYQMTKMRKENAELKFGINNLNLKIEKELKQLKYFNKVKDKELNECKNNLQNNTKLIKLLGQKIAKYEKNFNSDNKNIQNIGGGEEQYLLLTEKNKKLKEELSLKKNMIESIQEEMNTKNEIIIELESMQKEKENCLHTIDSLNQELQARNILIEQMKNDIQTLGKSVKKEGGKNSTNVEKDEKLLNELKKFKEEENKLNLELTETQKKFYILQENNIKMNKIATETNNMIKTTMSARDKLKNEYESAIKELIEKYEKQIKFMQMVLDKQNEEFEEKMKNLQSENLEILPKDGKNMEEVMKLIQQNKDLLKQNEKLKNLNETMLLKMKDLPTLEQKYEDLFDTIKLLQEENKLLKEARDYSSIIELSQNKLKNMENDENGGKKVLDKKNQLLDDEESEEEEEEKKSDNIKMTQIKQKEIIYNKKPIPNPKLSSTKCDKNSVNNSVKEEEKEQNEEDNGEQNLDISTNINFNIYKPIKEGLLSFNLGKKNFETIVPEDYEKFLEGFDPENSIQYNTLEGLFFIKNNLLLYYSRKKNKISELINFKEDHSYGCLVFDNFSKNMIALGGKNTKTVEKFSFETGKLEYLPSFSSNRSKMACCLVNKIIYCFFGICEDRPNDSIVEILDLDNLSEGWKEIKFENKTSFKILTGMSCINLNDSEFFIIGGLKEDETPNDKLLYFNEKLKEFTALDKDLPKSEESRFVFYKNNIFNGFPNENTISFVNIDDNNQVHILDSELKYDLYVPPKI